MEKESTDNLLVNNRASKKKQQPKFLFDGREYRDDSKLKAYLKKERKAKEVILAREKRPAGIVLTAPVDVVSRQTNCSRPPLHLTCTCATLALAHSPNSIRRKSTSSFRRCALQFVHPDIQIEGFQRIEREKSKPWVLVVFDSSEVRAAINFSIMV